MGKKINSEYITFVIDQFNKTINQSFYSVYVGHKEYDNGDIKYYSAKPEDWEHVIDKLFEKSISLEEYELSSKIKELKPVILSESNKRLSNKQDYELRII
jgi:uncharacterized CHY-type Zn-finger protein